MNKPGKNGRTAIISAAYHDNVEVVNMLVHAGGDVNHADIDGISSLIASSRRGHVGIVTLLLAAGADHNVVDISGNNPLVLATETKHKEIVALVNQRIAEVAQTFGAAAAIAVTIFGTEGNDQD